MAHIDTKDWQLLLIGAAFSLLISLVIAAWPDLRALVLRLRGKSPEERALLRVWHTYHFTRDRDGKADLRYEQWVMRRRFFRVGRIRVVTQDPEKPDLLYHGTFRKEHNTIVLFFKADHTETIYVRFHYPLVRLPQETIYGLISGIDFRMNPYQTTVLISSEKLSKQDAKSMLQQRTEFVFGELSIRLRSESPPEQSVA